MKAYRYKAQSDRYWEERQHGRISWDEFKEKMRKLIKKAERK